jgi:hypothetical protein
MEMHSVHSEEDGGDEELGGGYLASVGSSRTASYSVNIKQGGSFFGGVKAGSIVPVASEGDFLGGSAAARDRVVGGWSEQGQATVNGDVA